MSERVIVELRQEIVNWEAKTTELEQQSQSANERVDELEEQRETYVLAALAEDDPGAKVQLEKLGLEVERGARHSADLVLAREQAGERVDVLRQELAKAERAAQEEELLRLVEQREAVGHELARLMEKEVLPQLRQAGELTEEMSRLAGRLGLECSIRGPAFTSLLAFPAWAVLKVFPMRFGAISTQPVEARDFRPPDFGLDPGEALVAHDQQFRRRLLKEIVDKRQAASEQVEAVAAAD